MKNTGSIFSAGTRVTRILFLFSFCFLSLHSYAVNADRYAQEKTLTVEVQNKTVKEVLDYIEKDSEFIFFYYNKAIDTKRNVSLSVKNKPITVILDQLFKGTDVQYEIKDRQISLKKEQIQQHSQDKKQQKRKLVGTVTDASTDEPLVGVSIQVKNASGTGTITDLNGKFSIEVFNNTELIFSYIGCKTQTLAVGDLGVLNVKMQPDNETLDEVVIVGAGTQKKVSVTGAITAVKGLELRVPSSSLTNNLSGKLSGVISVTNSGEPGSTSQFFIRGISTFGGRTAPLILLDGVEISSNDLNNIPSETIESFSVLKDASATAIYGARGANGVMLVTTKSGLENTKAKINVSFEQSFQKPVNIVEFADGVTFMETYNEAQLSRTESATPRYSQTQIKNTLNKVNPYVFPDVDWYGLMFKNFTSSQRGNINIQGGGSRVTYYMSLQANHDGGILDIPSNYSFDNNYNRWFYTFQNNIGYKITSTTKVDLRMNAQITQQKSPENSTQSIFRQVLENNPVTFPAMYPGENEDEHIRFGSAIMSSQKYFTNPYAYMLNTFKQTNENKLNISLNLDQKLDFITKGLSVTALVNFNNWSQKYYTRSLKPYLYRIADNSWNEVQAEMFELDLLEKGEKFINESDIIRSSNNTFYFDARLNYNRHFGDHALTGMLMYMMREYSYGALPNRNQGFSGRVTYDWKNRYLAEFNFGYNGTERLAKEERFEFFPAMSLGWVISNENFWEPLNKYVDYLKIRGSYGLVGSDETGLDAGAPHFLYINNVNMNGGQSFATGYTGGVTYTGPSVNSYAIENPHWERSKQFDVGVDMRLFNQINVTFDYYHNKRDRILMKRASFPSILGYSTAIPWSNIGKVDNKGIELSINWTKQFNRDFYMDFRANYTYSKNKYVYIDEPDYPYTWQTQTNKPLSNTVGYIAEGLFKDEEDIATSADQSFFGSKIMPGDIKYRDMNGDGRITEEDKTMLSGYGRVPRIQYGFGMSMVYKKIDFSVFFNGSAKRDFLLTDVNPFCADDSNDRNLMKWIADSHWKVGADNSNVLYPRMGVLKTQIANNQQPSSYWMRNGSFLRFKTLEVGYTFPYGRIYFSGDNLAVWSPFKYWDPELWYDTYPLQRTFNIGIQFNF
ncbi:TonB-dependent receptor [Bacteroides finegoldii]|uniref:TonB-dependent receptor n=1 Tax=Bacteroides finegoldii TaxID=338188 RepID=UPI0018A0F9FA|nr:TonB-dependent receptor [Bacteroides finegoldii]